MKKHYIVIATKDEGKHSLIHQYIKDEYRNKFNFEMDPNSFNNIFEFWDKLDNLSIEQQSNTLVIFDPGLYTSSTVKVTNIDNGTNYWHDVGERELFPWYELTLRYPIITSTYLTFKQKLFGEFKGYDSFLNIDLTQCIKSQLDVNMKLFFSGFRTWFDPFGLRDYWRYKVLRDIFNTTKVTNEDDTLKYNKVYCLEDEISFGMLNSYVAYKYGNNVSILESFKTLEWAEEKEKDAFNEILIIKDRDLRYRDINDDQERKRGTLKPENGVFIDRSNKETITISSDLNGLEQCQVAIKKPLFDMYDLVDNDKGTWFINENKRNNMKKIKDGDSKGNHSSPYVNMQLSKEILKPVENANDSIEHKIFMALLYMESYLILNKMAETTSLELLKKIHLSEIEFILSFMGVDKNQKIKFKKEDIENDLESFLGGEKSEIRESFLISFWNDAKTIYQKHEQFDAAEEANFEAMNSLKWVMKRDWRLF